MQSFLETYKPTQGYMHNKNICVGLVPMEHWHKKETNKKQHKICCINVYKDVDMAEKCICICAHGSKNGLLEYEPGHCATQSNVLESFLLSKNGERLIAYCHEKKLKEYQLYTHGCYDHSRSTPESIEKEGVRFTIRSLTDLGCTSTFLDSTKMINGKEYAVIVFEEIL